jgi:2'-5' RNA ligase
MTIQYAIVAFPVLDEAGVVESVRRRFDPLASMLSAHITLVFPFTDAASEADLTKHIAGVVAGQRAFDITLADISVEDSGYVFLSVEAGAAVLCDLHDRLYTDLLAAYLSSAHEYRPHITIGRLLDPEQIRLAAEEARMHLSVPFRGKVNEVALFRINEANHGDVVGTTTLLPGSARPASGQAIS